MEASRRPIALVVALAVGILIGLLIGAFGQGEPDREKEQEVARQPAQTDGAGGDSGQGVRSPDGAAVAAREHVLLSATDVIRDREAFIAAMQSAAAPTWADEARKQAVEGHAFLTDRYGADVDVTAAVMRYKVLEYSPDAASVKLWLVSVASGSEQERVDEAWGTALVQLSWIDGRWRVADVSNSNGPSPVDLPTGETVETAESLMRELHEVPVATP